MFFRNLKISKCGMPKKMMPKSQAKIKPQFLQYPFLSLNLIMRIYSNVYECTIYQELLVFLRALSMH